jgi:hypothetical protein
LYKPDEWTVNANQSVENPNRMLHLGTLLDLLPCDDNNEQQALNVLDIPMGGAQTTAPPGYGSVHVYFFLWGEVLLFAEAVFYLFYVCLRRYLATNEKAWQETRDVPAITSINFPNDDMVWGTASTRNATTWGHIDDLGMASVIRIMTGRKYWVIMYPKRDASR